MDSQSRQATDENYAAQAAIAAALSRVLSQQFESIEPGNLSESLKRFIAIVFPFVQQHARGSRGISTRYYTDMRRYAGVGGAFRPSLVGLPPLEQVQSVTRWATDGLWTGGDMDVALSKLLGGLEKATLDTGRWQVAQAADDDRQAGGWAREAKPDACWFCAMLATRGGVYDTEQTAGAKANRKFKGAGAFKFHDNCHCTVVPVFGEYEPTAHVRGWEKLYADSTENVGGMRAKQKAFREALAKSREPLRELVQVGG